MGFTAARSASILALPDGTMVAMSLPADYGYVIMTGVGAIFMVMWKGIRVGKARKEHGVQYPDMYSPDNKVFNCIQRAHQNTLENLPQFMFLLTMGGLSSPLCCCRLGLDCWQGGLCTRLQHWTS